MQTASNLFRRAPAIVVALVMLLAAGVAAAHHGWGNYDSEHPVTLTGPITKVAFEQPHVEINLAAGEQDWLVILAPISRMESRGVSQPMLQVGRTITAYGYPHRDIKNEMRAERITIDGRTYEMR